MEGGAALSHWRRGEGEPLVLLHGLGGTRVIWEPVAAALARHREVIAVDLPGFGESAPLPEGVEPTAAALADAVAGFCAGAGVERPHVAGNSLGGWVALELGRAGLAASVTALSPAGLWANPLGPRSLDARRWARRLKPVLRLALLTPGGRRRLLASTMARPDRVGARDAQRLVMGWIDSPGYEAANAAMRSHVFDPRGYPELPVTVAWGEEDRLVGRPRPHRLPPGARLLSLPGCGHTPTWDDPELVAAVLLEGSGVAATARADQVA
jgi:pimeloyl-ACP methyl ester carboxylesterase